MDLARTLLGTVSQKQPRAAQGLAITRLIEIVKPFTCSFCNQEFKKSGDLTSHLGVHTENGIHKCSECTKIFTIRSMLLTHMKVPQNQASLGMTTVAMISMWRMIHTADLMAHLKQNVESFHYLSELLLMMLSEQPRVTQPAGMLEVPVSIPDPTLLHYAPRFNLVDRSAEVARQVILNAVKCAYHGVTTRVVTTGFDDQIDRVVPEKQLVGFLSKLEVVNNLMSGNRIRLPESVKMLQEKSLNGENMVKIYNTNGANNGMKPGNDSTNNCSPELERVQELMRSQEALKTDITVHSDQCTVKYEADWQLVNQCNHQASSLAMKGKQLRTNMYIVQPGQVGQRPEDLPAEQPCFPAIRI